MKKCIFILIFISKICLGQNWQPIVSSNKYCYFSSPNFSSASIIKVDSAKIQGSDSLFFLNRVLKPIASQPNKLLKNQGQFLQKQVVSRSNGTMTFMGDSSFTLKIYAALNDSWIFDTLLNLTATVVDLRKDSVLGQLDSIKVIRISNSDTIHLSKNYGITYYKKSALNNYNTLKGIKNLNLGFISPDYKEIYDFNVGDVFEYRDYNYHNGLSIASYYYNIYHYKLTILTKTVSINQISYTAEKISSDTSGGFFQQTPVITQQTTTISLNYTDSSSNFLNAANHSLIEGAKCTNGSVPPVYNESYFSLDSTFQAYTKNYINIASIPNSANTFLINNPTQCYSDAIYGNKLGIIYYRFDDYAYSSANYYHTYLCGCIKNGVQYGTISSGLNNIKENVSDESLKIYPSLFRDYINLSGHTNFESSLDVFDIYGRKVYSSIFKMMDKLPIQIDLSFLESGSYIIKIAENNSKPEIRKVIKID